MAANGYKAATEGTVAVSTTAKTVLAVKAPTNRVVVVNSFTISFGSVASAAKPARVEVVRYATDGTGTAVTPQLARGSQGAVGATAKKDYTVEPGTPALIEEYWLDVYKGLLRIDYPLGREIHSPNGGLVGLRVTLEAAETATSCRAFVEWEE